MKFFRLLLPAALLVLCTNALAGEYKASPVFVDLNEQKAGGNLYETRFTGNTEDRIGCALGSGVRGTYAYCEAFDGTDVAACLTYDQKIIDVIASINTFSWVYFEWGDKIFEQDGTGIEFYECNHVTVATRSTHIPRVLERTGYEIGDYGPAGGTVFYVTDNGLHGVEAAPVDQGIAQWGCVFEELSGAMDEGPITGLVNTHDILTQCLERPIAASIAADYELKGYNDWYLPSLGELDELLRHTDIIGGLAEAWYWTSTQVDDSTAWALPNFVVFPWVPSDKRLPGRVRAIRQF